MSKFSKLNRRNTVMKGIDTQNMEFRPLKDFCGQTLKCVGFFFTQGNFGKQVVIVANGYLVNMPARATEQFLEIEKDEELLNAVLNGELSITDIKMIDTKNGTTTAYELV